MTMLLSPRFFLSLLATCLVFAVGCGGDDDEGGGGNGNATTQADEAAGADDAEEEEEVDEEFVEDAEDGCEDLVNLREEAQETVEAFAADPADGNLSEVAETIEGAAETAEEALGELQDLDPPASAEDDWEELLDLHEEQIEAIRAVGRLASRRTALRTTLERDAEDLTREIEDPAIEDRGEEIEELAESVDVPDCA